MKDKPTWTEQEQADLVAYLDGELDKNAAGAIQAKLDRDPQARAEAESLRRTWGLLDYLPRPEPSTDFTSRTLEQLTPPPRPAWLTRYARWRPLTLGVGWAAAVLVAGALGYGGGSWLGHRRPATPRPADIDPLLVRDLRVIENLHLYEHVDDIDFLNKLDNANDPDLFGEDNHNS
jgi:hypothetical protein